MNDLFGDVISCYSWQNAVDDGILIEVTGLAKQWGFIIPVAITQGVFKCCEDIENTDQTNKNITRLLVNMIGEIQKLNHNDNRIFFKHNFQKEEIDVWGSVEGRDPSNPEPVVTILLPEEN